MATGYNKAFHFIPVDVPNRSGHDLSHTNDFTATTGTLVPALVEPVIPNETFSLDVFSQIQLPPVASDFYGSIRAKFEAFFVPYRILWGSWKYFITDNNDPSFSEANLPTVLPSYGVPHSQKSFLSAGTLSDYLGFKMDPLTLSSWDSSANSITIKNCLPFLAYHKIWDDYYRNPRIQKPFFCPPSFGANSTFSINNLPFINFYTSGLTSQAFSDEFLSLRQRAWNKDYFTNATPEPQAGDASKVSFDTSGANGEFTIAALRAANSLQQFRERNNLAGSRYGDQIKAHFGIYPSDAVTDRAIFLGDFEVDVYTKSVYNQSGFANTFPSSPFNGIASKFGSPQAVGNGSLLRGKSFTTSEHGFIFVMFSLIPQARYSSGIRRYLMYDDVSDFPWPLLQGVGDQEIKYEELAGYNFASDMEGVLPTFGYTQRYSEAKYHEDEVHGLLRDGESLSSFALQRSFSLTSGLPVLGSEFIEIPKNFLDQVFVTNDKISGFSCWVNCAFKFHKSSPLSPYSIPTLGDMKNVHTEIINNGGQML